MNGETVERESWVELENLVMFSRDGKLIMSNADLGDWVPDDRQVYALDLSEGKLRVRRQALEVDLSKADFFDWEELPVEHRLQSRSWPTFRTCRQSMSTIAVRFIAQPDRNDWLMYGALSHTVPIIGEGDRFYQVIDGVLAPVEAKEETMGSCLNQILRLPIWPDTHGVPRTMDGTPQHYLAALWQTHRAAIDHAKGSISEAEFEQACMYQPRSSGSMPYPLSTTGGLTDPDFIKYLIALDETGLHFSPTQSLTADQVAERGLATERIVRELLGEAA